MKIKDIREMRPDELSDQAETLKKKLFEIRTQSVTEKLEDPSLLAKLRRDIARIKTVMRENELARKKQA